MIEEIKAEIATQTLFMLNAIIQGKFAKLYILKGGTTGELQVHAHALKAEINELKRWKAVLRSHSRV